VGELSGIFPKKHLIVDFWKQNRGIKRYNELTIMPLAGSQRSPRHLLILWPLKGASLSSHAQMQRESAFGSKKIRCVLAHDHVLLRQGLRRLLEDQPDMEVVAEAGNAGEALREVFEHRPEVVIADAHIFEYAADHSERLILQQSPQSKVLFLTTHEGGDRLRAEASSCAVRQTSAEELVEMVRRADSMDRVAVREIAQSVEEELPIEDLPRKRGLTAREREVLKLLAEGKTVRSAAGVLGLSAKTVDAHKFNLMRKLGVHNKAELVMCAIQKKVVKVPANS
jgi:DNA-binding NarL/FixJ family response regulator